MRWSSGGPEDGEVWLPEVGNLRQAMPWWGSQGLRGVRELDFGVLDRLGQTARAAEVEDGDQGVLLDELQRLEGQDMLDILGRENSTPIRVPSQLPPPPPPRMLRALQSSPGVGARAWVDCLRAFPRSISPASFPRDSSKCWGLCEGTGLWPH